MALLCASFSPSLLPRHWVFQGIVSGLVLTAGYGLGTLASHLWRSLPTPEPSRRVKRVAWPVLAGAGAGGVAVTWWMGAMAQLRLHRMMGMEAPQVSAYLLSLPLAAIIAVVLVVLGRGIRLSARRIARILGRWLPPRVAGILGGLVVGAVLIGLADGFIVDRFFAAADETFRVTDRVIPDDATQPASPLRSGSPASLVAWEDLGSKGRTFVSGALTRDELARFSDTAQEPIRVYAGLDTAETIQGRVDVALRELERTGAFQRDVLCVMTATGTGWIDPQAAAALEYIWAGDSALVSVQYSYLPSWISFLVDSVRAREAGAELFNRVYEEWASLPEGTRPLLLVFGESLGADGSEAAFSGVADLRNRTDGVMWVGPPNFSRLWSRFVDDRNPGSLERLPNYQDGETVRFAGSLDDLQGMEEPWPPPRVLYLQHASDPVVWWSPRLILRRPDWLTEPGAGYVLESVRWYPLVTFLQLTVDLANSIRVPPGHGHNYASLLADGWAGVASPPGWTAADTRQLRRLLVDQAESERSSWSG